MITDKTKNKASEQMALIGSVRLCLCQLMGQIRGSWRQPLVCRLCNKSRPTVCHHNTSRQEFRDMHRVITPPLQQPPEHQPNAHLPHLSITLRRAEGNESVRAPADGKYCDPWISQFRWTFYDDFKYKKSGGGGFWVLFFFPKVLSQKPIRKTKMHF